MMTCQGHDLGRGGRRECTKTKRVGGRQALKIEEDSLRTKAEKNDFVTRYVRGDT